MKIERLKLITFALIVNIIYHFILKQANIYDENKIQGDILKGKIKKPASETQKFTSLMQFYSYFHDREGNFFFAREGNDH